MSRRARTMTNLGARRGREDPGGDTFSPRSFLVIALGLVSSLLFGHVLIFVLSDFRNRPVSCITFL